MDTKSIKRGLTEITNKDLLKRFRNFTKQMDILNKEDLEIEEIFKKEILKRMKG